MAAETNRLYKGIRLETQGELMNRIFREGGEEGRGLLNLRRTLQHQIESALSDLRKARQAVAGPDADARIQEAGKRLAALQKQDADAERKLRTFNYKALQPSVSDQEVRRTLEPDSAFLDIAYYEPFHFEGKPKQGRSIASHYAVFVYLPESVYALDLKALDDPKLKAVLGKVLRTADRLHQGSLSSTEILQDLPAVQKDLKSLYVDLFGPIRTKIGPGRFAKIKHWIVSPDGELGAIPLEMLIDTDGRYLVETSLVSYAESARALVQRNTGEPNSAAVAFLDPQYDPRIKDRPQDRERNLSGSLYQGHLGKYFLDANPKAKLVEWQAANEAALMQVRRPAGLLIWTHGEFAQKEGDPLARPRILLAGVKNKQSPTQDYDGYVTARKMMSLDLTGTRLAVIAGCETGVGTPEAGEGIPGMRRALWVAGAQSQLLTLWEVADRHTVRWLELFYGELRKPAMTRAGAARSVQRTFIEGKVQGLGQEQKHPYFWAPFMLSGDWSSDH
jgi:CHAT domain-containing protein